VVAYHTDDDHHDVDWTLDQPVENLAEERLSTTRSIGLGSVCLWIQTSALSGSGNDVSDYIRPYVAINPLS
jgi:hypothetical protein